MAVTRRQRLRSNSVIEPKPKEVPLEPAVAKTRKRPLPQDSSTEPGAEPHPRKRASNPPTTDEPTTHEKPAQAATRQYWLMKAEPATRLVNGHDVKFGIDDLAACGESDWDGVRNHEAKNNMAAMRRGDLALFYHSNAPKSRPDLGPGIAGVMEIVNDAPVVDYTAFDKTHPYYDAKSQKDAPRWVMARVRFVRKMKRVIPLHEIKRLVNQEKIKQLQDFALVKRSRLSVVPVTKPEWDYIMSIEEKQDN